MKDKSQKDLDHLLVWMNLAGWSAFFIAVWLHGEIGRQSLLIPKVSLEGNVHGMAVLDQDRRHSSRMALRVRSLRGFSGSSSLTVWVRPKAYAPA